MSGIDKILNGIYYLGEAIKVYSGGESQPVNQEVWVKSIFQIVFIQVFYLVLHIHYLKPILLK